MPAATNQQETVLLEGLTADLCQSVLQDAGYRVEFVPGTQDDTPPVLRSATGGMVFEMRFANRLADPGRVYADTTFLSALTVEGDLPLALLNEWNASHRFTRLYLAERLLVLAMDVGVLGGVSRDHIRVQLDIWDQSLQGLIAFLREELPKLAKAAPSAVPLPSPERV